MTDEKKTPAAKGGFFGWWGRFQEKDIVELAPIGAAIVFAMVGGTHWYLLAKSDIAKAGQTGDFFGGILNPALAFFALLVLVKATKFQKTEMEETRKHFQIEARRNELYRLVESASKRMDGMLDLTVQWTDRFGQPHKGRLGTVLTASQVRLRQAAVVLLRTGERIPLYDFCRDGVRPELDYLFGLSQRYEALEGGTGELKGFVSHNYAEVQDSVSVALEILSTAPAPNAQPGP